MTNKENAPPLSTVKDEDKEAAFQQRCRQKRAGWVYTSDINTLLLYQNNNKIKEIDLKHKISRGEKVKVLFLMTNICQFSTKTIYKKMLEGDLFDPYILAITSNDLLFSKDDSSYHGCMNLCNILEDRGYRVIRGYDNNKKLIPIEQHQPDILFYTSPFLDHTDSVSSNLYLNYKFLTCYVAYGMNTINNFGYHYNNKNINTAWKYFCDTKRDYEMLLGYSIDFGLNCVLSGAPKLDDYRKDLKDCVIPEKINNGKKTVIYAPHWAIRYDGLAAVNLSTFHLYYKYFLSLLKKYPDINFVFKPHPRLYSRTTIETNTLTTEEYNNYINDWDSQPNGLYVYDGEYIDLFRASSCLITDSGSFIGEYLPSENPCIYLVNPERDPNTYLDGFSSLGNKILDTYHLAYSQDQIQDYFEKIIIEGIDTTKQQRLKILEQEYVNIGTASEKIIEYLTDILTNK